MIITYYNASFFKIVFGDTTLAINPIGEKSVFKSPKFGADIALVSIHDDNFNGISRVSHGEKTPIVIDGPGEYEIRDIFIRGFMTDTLYGGKQKINTLYTIIIEGMRLCFLGALSSPDISTEIIEELGVIDICFIPTSLDTGIIGPKEAHRVGTILEPRIIIPAHYTDKSLKSFLDEEGVSLSPVEKLVIKKKDLDEKGGDVIVLSPGI